jgi:transcription elongation factor GreA
MDSAQYLSPDKKKELEVELAELKGPKRQVVLDALSFARSLGDLSENAEYHNAREEQGRLEERIGKIEEVLRSSVIVTKHTTNKVSVGSVVIVKKKGDKATREFILVGSEEADMAAGKISNNSPIGAALMGKAKGDTVVFKTPKGETEYTISDIK